MPLNDTEVKLKTKNCSFCNFDSKTGDMNLLLCTKEQIINFQLSISIQMFKKVVHEAMLFTFFCKKSVFIFAVQFESNILFD